MSVVSAMAGRAFRSREEATDQLGRDVLRVRGATAVPEEQDLVIGGERGRNQVDGARQLRRLLGDERLFHLDALGDEPANGAFRVPHPASGGFGSTWST